MPYLLHRALLQVPKARKVIPDRQVPPALQARLGHRVIKVIPARQVPPELRAQQVRLALLVV